MKSFTRSVLLITILTQPFSRQGFSQGNEHPTDLFDYNHPFPVTISYDFRELNKSDDETNTIPGKISYYLKDSTLIERSISIRPRGASRRDQCLHPPLRISFNDSLYGVDLFDQWGKIKLVSKCQQAGNFDAYVVKEYLIYKAYEKLTDAGFRTYFLNITFFDEGSGKRSYESMGYFIEDIDDLEERLNAVEVESLGVAPVELDTLGFDIMALFQYMIGNTDWYVQNLHNIKLIKYNDHMRPSPIPVPYDFDYSGLVNTSYAVPHENLSISSVRERFFMGVCRKESNYAPVLKLFLDKKDEIYGIFNNCKSLSKYDKKDISIYLDGFFRILKGKNPGRFIYGNCE